MYETDDIKSGILTRDALYATVKCTLAITRDESDTIFFYIDKIHQQFIKFSK